MLREGSDLPEQQLELNFLIPIPALLPPYCPVDWHSL